MIVKPIHCNAGLWIDTGKQDTSKIIFDLLYSHKEEIESKVPLFLMMKSYGLTASTELALATSNHLLLWHFAKENLDRKESLYSRP